MTLDSIVSRHRHPNASPGGTSGRHYPRMCQREQQNGEQRLSIRSGASKNRGKGGNRALPTFLGYGNLSAVWKVGTRRRRRNRSSYCGRESVRRANCTACTSLIEEDWRRRLTAFAKRRGSERPVMRVKSSKRQVVGLSGRIRTIVRLQSTAPHTIHRTSALPVSANRSGTRDAHTVKGK